MIAERIWLFGDLSQAESRVVAWRGPVPKLKEWYKRGDDVHLHVTHLVARIVQEAKLKLPNNLFTRKHWDAYTKKDEEREQCKRVVHGSNYEMGIDKLALILNVDTKTAEILANIYFTLFPEIKSNYHSFIRRCLERNHTIQTPEPVPFRKRFWSMINPETLRQAYASYPQITVSSLLNNVLDQCASIFLDDHDEKLKDQWCTWYGSENWDAWRHLRDRGLRTPMAILWSGMDIRLNVHDSTGTSIPNDPDLVFWAASVQKSLAEVPIMVDPNDPLVIPYEFKIGKNAKDLTDYKVMESAIR